MMKPAALAALSLVTALAASAHADDGATTTTTTAGTLVVVTPNAPVVVTTGGAAAAVAAPTVGGPSTIAPTAPTAAGAPHNEDWSNVSNINGQVVPVGERGAYLFTQKKTNLAVNPFGVMFGYYDGSVSYAVSQQLVLSGSVSGWSLDSTTGYEVAVSLPIYFRRAYSGPFLEPGLVSRSSTDTNLDGAAPVAVGVTSLTDTWAGPEVLFGWHWSFDSGLNAVMAFGAAKRVASSDSYRSNDAEPVGYFRVGYAF
jgi:hypothetical protein